MSPGRLRYHGWELKERIKEALSKKGFSLVEVFSPCPTHFGKNNDMKQTREMLGWLRDRGITGGAVPAN